MACNPEFMGVLFCVQFIFFHLDFNVYALSAMHN